MKKSLLFATMLFAAVFVFGDAVPNSLQAQKGKKFTGRLPTYWRRLGLSKDQIQTIYKTQSEYDDKKAALEAQLKKLESDEKTALFKVLTTKQFERLRKIYQDKLGIDLGTPPKKKSGVEKKK